METWPANQWEVGSFRKFMDDVKQDTLDSADPVTAIQLAGMTDIDRIVLYSILNNAYPAGNA